VIGSGKSFRINAGKDFEKEIKKIKLMSAVEVTLRLYEKKQGYGVELKAIKEVAL